MLEDDFVEVWCVQSATHVPYIDISNKIHAIRVFVIYFYQSFLVIAKFETLCTRSHTHINYGLLLGPSNRSDATILHLN
jgi:hypothetical protein